MSEVHVELFCSRCNTETTHRGTISGSQLEVLVCDTCGLKTRLPGYNGNTHLADEPKTEAAQRFLCPFGGQGKPWVMLGSGPVVVEGSLTPPSPQTPLVQQSVSVVEQALRLKEADAHVLRLVIEARSQLELIKPIHATTALPVVIEVGENRELLAGALASRADAVVLSIRSPEEVDSLPDLNETPVFIRILLDGLTPKAALRVAEAITTRFLRRGMTRAVFSLAVSDLELFVSLHREFRQRVGVPIRAELTQTHFTRSPAHAWLAMGTLLADGTCSIAAPAGAAKQVQAVDEANHLLRGLGFLMLPYGRDRVRAFRYYTRKTLNRVLSKPMRMVRELGANPGLYLRSLPRRVLTKPVRLIEEFRRIAARLD